MASRRASLSPRPSSPRPRSRSPKAAFSILGQIKTVSRDEIRQEAIQDPYLEVYRAEKRPLSPQSINHSPSRDLTFVAVTRFTGPDGSDDLTSLGRSLTTLQGTVDSQAKELEKQAAVLEEHKREIADLQPMKEWFYKQNMELYWSKVGSPRGVAAYEILREVGNMLTSAMQSFISEEIQRLQSGGEEDGASTSGCEATTKRERREQVDAYRQLFGRGPFRSKKFKHGTYEDLLMHVVAKENREEPVEQAFIDALEAAEMEFYQEATEAVRGRDGTSRAILSP